MRTRTSFFAVIFLWGMGTAFAQSPDSAGVPNAAQSTPAQATQAQAPAAAADSAPAAPAAPVIPAMTGPQLLIATSMGDITLQLDSVRAPKSVANVLRYVREKHYDGTTFYRVAKGFVIQMGSWDAKMKGRPIHAGSVPLESGNGLSNVRGTAALAHGDAPDSATAEFFINVGDNSALDRKPDDAPATTGFAVFGQVVAGMDVVDAINAVPVGDGGPMPGQTPVTPIVIKKVTIIPAPK